MLRNSKLIALSLSFGVIALFSCNNSELKVTSDKNQSTESSQQPALPISMDSPESYEKLLQNDSLNIDIRLKLAAVYYTNKNYDKAIYHYLIINSIDKENLAALFNLGNIYYDTQRNKEAIQYYERFLKLDNKNSNVRCDLATCYMKLDNTDKAISLLRDNIKINFNHPQSHYNLSVMLRQSGKTAEAEEEMKIYNSLIQAQPGQSN